MIIITAVILYQRYFHYFIYLFINYLIFCYIIICKLRILNAFSLRYDEINNYNFSTGASTNGKAIGHFTQIVWKTTTNIGVGIATVKVNKYIRTYVVGKYLPAGNMVGSYVKNVMPVIEGGNKLKIELPVEFRGILTYCRIMIIAFSRRRRY